jgi:PST family polysaccharide transporter
VRYRKAFMQMIQMVHLAAIPGMVCAIALPDQVVLTLFGQKWAGVSPIFFWLAIAGLTSFMGNGSGWLFTSQGRAAGRFRWECASAVLLVTSFVVGLPYGAVGVARAYAITCVFIQGPILWWAVTRIGPVRLRDMLTLLYPFAVAGICAYAVLVWCLNRYDFNGMAGLVVGAAISYAVSGAILAALPEGRRILRNALAVKSMLRRPA